MPSASRAQDAFTSGTVFPSREALLVSARQRFPELRITASSVYRKAGQPPFTSAACMCHRASNRKCTASFRAVAQNPDDADGPWILRTVIAAHKPKGQLSSQFQLGRKRAHTTSAGVQRSHRSQSSRRKSVSFVEDSSDDSLDHNDLVHDHADSEEQPFLKRSRISSATNTSATSVPPPWTSSASTSPDIPIFTLHARRSARARRTHPSMSCEQSREPGDGGMQSPAAPQSPSQPRRDQFSVLNTQPAALRQRSSVPRTLVPGPVTFRDRSDFEDAARRAVEARSRTLCLLKTRRRNDGTEFVYCVTNKSATGGLQPIHSRHLDGSSVLMATASNDGMWRCDWPDLSFSSR